MKIHAHFFPQVCSNKCDQLRHFSWSACNLPPRFWFKQLDQRGVDPIKMVCWGLPNGPYYCGVYCSRDHNNFIYDFWMWCYCKHIALWLCVTEDQWKMTPKGALVHHPKDLLPPWRDSMELFWRCDDIVFTVRSTIPVIPDTPLSLAHSIPWHSASKGFILVKVFGGIKIRFTSVLGVGLTIR